MLGARGAARRGVGGATPPTRNGARLSAALRPIRARTGCHCAHLVRHDEAIAHLHLDLPAYISDTPRNKKVFGRGAPSARVQARSAGRGAGRRARDADLRRVSVCHVGRVPSAAEQPVADAAHGRLQRLGAAPEAQRRLRARAPRSQRQGGKLGGAARVSLRRFELPCCCSGAVCVAAPKRRPAPRRGAAR